MSFRYAKSVPTSDNNATAEIMKAAADEKVISFAGGLPAPELFPVKQMKLATDKVFDLYGEKVLQYANTLGYPELRNQIVEIMKDRKVITTKENVAISTGSQQAIDLVARMLINPGDVIISEDPTYLAAIDVFKSYGAKIVGVSMDEDGIRTDELRQIVKQYPNAKFIYTIPNFQNPTGRTMTIERRQQLVEIANEMDIPIVEDDPYGAIRYTGEFLTSLKHFDTENRVIYLSSFSKILAPGMRLGWIVANEEFMVKFMFLKQNADLHTDNLTQYIVSQFLKDVDLKEHIKKITQAYEHRANLMLAEIEKHFPKNVHHSNPEGGMFIWIEVPGINTNLLFDECLKHNVAFVPGSAFYANEVQQGTFRMNFSNMNDQQIVEGVKRMSEAIVKVMPS